MKFIRGLELGVQRTVWQLRANDPVMKVRAKILPAIFLVPYFLASCAIGGSDSSSPSSRVISNERRPGYEDRPYFRTGSDVLDLTASEAIVHAAKLIVRDSTKVRLVGHTDDCDDEESNLKLSQRRANVVRDRMVSIGVPAGLIVSVLGIGSSDKRLGEAPCSLPYNDRVDIDIVF